MMVYWISILTINANPKQVSGKLYQWERGDKIGVHNKRANGRIRGFKRNGIKGSK